MSFIYIGFLPIIQNPVISNLRPGINNLAAQAKIT